MYHSLNTIHRSYASIWPLLVVATYHPDKDQTMTCLLHGIFSFVFGDRFGSLHFKANIGIGKSEENETDNEEEQTSGGKSTKVPVAGQNKPTSRACTTRFQLYRAHQGQCESQL